MEQTDKIFRFSHSLHRIVAVFCSIIWFRYRDFRQVTIVNTYKLNLAVHLKLTRMQNTQMFVSSRYFFAIGRVYSSIETNSRS